MEQFHCKKNCFSASVVAFGDCIPVHTAYVTTLPSISLKFPLIKKFGPPQSSWRGGVLLLPDSRGQRSTPARQPGRAHHVCADRGAGRMLAHVLDTSMNAQYKTRSQNAPSIGGSPAVAADWSVGSTPASAANVVYQSAIAIGSAILLPRIDDGIRPPATNAAPRTPPSQSLQHNVHFSQTE